MVTQPQGVTQTTFRAVSDHVADSYYQITLRVTDSSGETDTKTATIRPETVSFAIASSPAGAPVSYAGAGRTAPFTTTSAIGFATTVTAAESFAKDGRTYAFDRWSDGRRPRPRHHDPRDRQHADRHLPRRRSGERAGPCVGL